MKTKVLENILSQHDIDTIDKIIKNEYQNRETIREIFPKSTKHNDSAIIYFDHLGRIDIRKFILPKDIIDKITKIVLSHANSSFTDIVFDFVIYAEYSLKSNSKPKLEPHFDISQSSTLILDYQLQSNTSWDLVVESEHFTLKDNDGLLFDPLSNIHYRPVKNFKNDEFVRMLFFRFSSSKPVIKKSLQDIDRLNTIQKQYNLTISSIY